MKRIFSTLALFTVAAFIAACGAPAPNAPANNSNANTAKPTAAAPTADALLEMEKKAQEAYTKADEAYFESMLSDKAVMSMGKDRMDKAGIVQMIKSGKCEGTTVNLSEPQMSKINEDTYAFTYKNASTGKCNDEKGKMTDLKATRASTVWVRNGDKWQAVWHGENEIMAAPTAGDKKDEKTADPKKEELKKEAPKKEEIKKEIPKKEEPKKEDKAAANSNAAAPTAAAKLTPSGNTDALTKLHIASWEAFRNKDGKFFETTIASNFMGVAPDGSYLGSRDAAIKEWTGLGTMKCEGITKTSFTEGFAQAISPTVEILFGKGNADGKCDGHPNGDLWTAAVYIKDGDAWKLAYMMESLPMPVK